MDYDISRRRRLRENFYELTGEFLQCSDLKMVILEYFNNCPGKLKDISEVIENNKLLPKNHIADRKVLKRIQHVKSNGDIIKGMVILTILQYEDIKTIPRLKDRIYYYLNTSIECNTAEKYVFEYLNSIQYSRRIELLNFLAEQNLFPSFIIAKKIVQSKLEKSDFCKLNKVSYDKYEMAEKLLYLSYYAKILSIIAELDNREHFRPKLVKQYT